MASSDPYISCDLVPTPLEVESALRAHGEELLSFLRRRAPTADDAADLRQDVLVRVLTTRTSTPIENARAYLFQIARRLLIDRRRRVEIETSIFKDANYAEDQPCTSPGPEAVVSGASDISHLETAVAELPARHRMALLWNRIDGLTLREIGERLGVTESMACRYVNEALAHCHKKMRQRERTP